MEAVRAGEDFFYSYIHKGLNYQMENTPKLQEVQVFGTFHVNNSIRIATYLLLPT